MTTLEDVLRSIDEYLEMVRQTPTSDIEISSEAAQGLRNAIREVREDTDRPDYPVVLKNEELQDAGKMIGEAFAHLMMLEARSEEGAEEDPVGFIADKFEAAVVVGMLLGYDLGSNEMWDGLDREGLQLID